MCSIREDSLAPGRDRMKICTSLQTQSTGLYTEKWTDPNRKQRQALFKGDVCRRAWLIIRHGGERTLRVVLFWLNRVELITNQTVVVVFCFVFHPSDQTKIFCLSFFVWQNVEPESPSRSALEFEGVSWFSHPPLCSRVMAMKVSLHVWGTDLWRQRERGNAPVELWSPHVEPCLYVCSSWRQNVGH